MAAIAADFGYGAVSDSFNLYATDGQTVTLGGWYQWGTLGGGVILTVRPIYYVL